MSKLVNRGLEGFLKDITTEKVRPKMTEHMMQGALYSHGRRKPLYTNIHYGCNEWDGIHISQSGYLTCYEIKLSRSDFKADFKKERHFLLNNNLEKHYENGHISLGLLPKYVYYVTYGFNIDISDIPKYAGLMILSETGFLETVKQAPKLWNVKITDKQIAVIYKTMGNRYMYHKCDDGNGQLRSWAANR